MLAAGALTKARAVDNENVLVQEQFPYKDIVAFWNVDARERVECATRRDAAHVRCCIAGTHRKISAGAQLANDLHQMILWSFQRRLNCILLRMIGRQTRPQKLVHTFDKRLHRRTVTAHDRPPNSPAWR